MTETVQTAESAPLSVDQAVASLLAPATETHEEEAAPVEAEAPAEEIEAPTEGEDAVSEAEAPGDDSEAEEVEAPVVALDPPAYWSKDAKAKFGELSPDLQAVVLEQEGPRETATAKARQEAADARKAAKQETDGIRQLAEQLTSFLPQAVETFNQKWGGPEPDWAAVAQQHGADQAFILKAQFDNEQKQLQQLTQAKQQAALEARKVTLREENDKLTGTPLEAIPARQEVAKYLSDSGYSPDELNGATARDLLMAHKAMKWDQAQAAAKAAPKPTPKPAPVAAKPAPVRPGAALPQVSSNRMATTAANRFAQTRSVDDAVSLLLAKGQRQ